MATLILYKDGAYNLFETIADRPLYESALTLEQLTEIIRQEFGEKGLCELPLRLERAHGTGCSCAGGTLASCIAKYEARPYRARTGYADFVARYLTLASNTKPAAPPEEQKTTVCGLDAEADVLRCLADRAALEARVHGACDGSMLAQKAACLEWLACSEEYRRTFRNASTVLLAEDNLVKQFRHLFTG